MKKILLIVTGIIILVSVPVLVFFFGQQQELRKNAAPATTLAITAQPNTIAVGDTVVCKIIINTATNKVASVRASLTFDQTKFEALSITNGALAPRILNQGTVGAGTATITVSAESTAKPISGQGEVAVLRLKAISGSASPVGVQFASDTAVIGIGENPSNVLVGNQPALITITGADTSTPPPSPPADASPTVTTTPAPTVTISPTTKPLENLFNQPASSSALNFSVYTEATRAGFPLVQGTASPSATVTVVIYSTPPQTLVVTAGQNGSWQTKPTTALKTGTYTIVVTALNAQTGTSETRSSTFTISGGIGGSSDTPEATADALPQSGSTQTTLLLLIASSILVLVGFFSLRRQSL